PATARRPPARPGASRPLRRAPLRGPARRNRCAEAARPRALLRGRVRAPRRTVRADGGARPMRLRRARQAAAPRARRLPGAPCAATSRPRRPRARPPPRRRRRSGGARDRVSRQARTVASSCSRRRRSRKGLALVTYGTLSKLYAGGGELVYHSSVSATQGSWPARRPTRVVRTTLIRKKSVPKAITKAPIVETRFHAVHQPRWLYVHTRRGIPSSPRKCRGKKVRWIATKQS